MATIRPIAVSNNQTTITASMPMIPDVTGSANLPFGPKCERQMELREVFS